MKGKSAFLSHLALIATLFIYTTCANAITAAVVEEGAFDLGDLIPGETIKSDLVSHSGSVSFRDEFSFNFIPPNSSSYSLLAAIDLTYTSPVSLVGFSSLFISLDGGEAINYLDFDYGEFVGLGSISSNSIHTIAVFGETLSAGAYYSVSVAAVPELEVWGMMVTGLAIMGLKLRRRKRIKISI